MNWQVVSIVLTAFIFLVNIGITITIIISNRASKKDDEKQTKGDLLVMKTIELVEAKIMGVINPLKDGIQRIEKDFEKKESEADQFGRVLSEISIRLSKLENLPERMSMIEKRNEELSRILISIVNDQKEKDS